MIKSIWFTEDEFNKCSPSCSLQDMNQEFIDMLDSAREIAGIPFVLTSAKRTVKHEKEKGRSGTGAHTLGCAGDIECTNSRERFIIVAALLKAGFTRIGISKTFIHADNSKNHDQKVIWLY